MRSGDATQQVDAVARTLLGLASTRPTDFLHSLEEIERHETGKRGATKRSRLTVRAPDTCLQPRLVISRGPGPVEGQPLLAYEHLQYVPATRVLYRLYVRVGDEQRVSAERETPR